MPPLPNSAAARDIAYSIHPQTSLRRHAEDGPVIISRGEGDLHLGRCGQPLSRDGCRVVVRLARLLRKRADRARRLRPNAQARLLSHVPASGARGEHRPRRKAHPDRSGADVEGAVPVLGLGGQRYRDQARLVLPGGNGAAAEEQDHRPPQRLSWQHHRRRQRLGQAGHARGLQSALADDAAHRVPPLLPST